jgi:uncharacterized protein (TIGR00304 family)
LRKAKFVSDLLLWNIGLILVLVGFAISLLAVLLSLVLSTRDKGRVKGGGAIIIGPIPIIFGTDKQSVKIILILSIILVALLLVLRLFSYNAL